jgi:hypothetical protein
MEQTKKMQIFHGSRDLRISSQSPCIRGGRPHPRSQPLSMYEQGFGSFSYYGGRRTDAEAERPAHKISHRYVLISTGNVLHRFEYFTTTRLDPPDTHE